MMRRVAVILAGLCLASPALAQAKDTPAMKLAQAMMQRFDAGWNKGDSRSVVALFDEQATLITPAARLTGIKAIEADLSRAVGKSERSASVDEAQAIGDEAVWANGSFKVAGKSGGPSFTGFWSGIFEKPAAGGWVMRLYMINVLPPPHPAK